MDVTLLIPTLNRPELLIRALHYYQSAHFNGKILIGDSSGASAAKLITDSLPQFANSFDIHYHYLPNYEPGGVLKILGEKTTTSYVAFIADDDFLVPKGIDKCLSFLNTNPDYAAAHGIGMVLNTAPDNADLIVHADFYQQPIVEEITATGRLSAHLVDYSVSLFSVHRTDVWRAMFKDVLSLGDKSFGSELLPCCLSVVLGKIKQIDELYLIRQNHQKRTQLPQWFEWMTNEAWRPSYLSFCEYLAEAIVQQDGTSLEETRLKVAHAFSVYLAQSIALTPKNSIETKPKGLINGQISGYQEGELIKSKNHLLIFYNKIRQIGKRIPGALKSLQALERLRDRIYRIGRPQSVNFLPILLNPSSHYHSDFMPIYTAIIKPSMETTPTKEKA